MLFHWKPVKNITKCTPLARGGVLPIMTYTGKGSSRKGYLLRLQVYERLGSSLVEVFERVKVG